MCRPAKCARPYFSMLTVLLAVVAVGTIAALSTPATAQDNSMPGMQMPAPSAPAAGAAAAPAAAETQAPPAPASHSIPSSVVIAAVIFVILMILFALAETRHWTRPRGAILGGLALLVAVYGITDYIVHVKKHPGQSTVWEATTMDMSTMKPVPGAVPVSIEKAQCGPFTAKISYTGTVVAFNDEDISPRVTGRVVSMPVYAGDEVRPGQLIARLDDTELGGREREAAAATRAAAANARAAGEEVSAAEAMRRQKAAAAQAMAVGIDEAQRMAQAARAKRTEAEKSVVEARHGATAASKEQSMAAARIAMAQSESEAARSGLDNAAADVDAASADLAYWEAEIKRMKALLDKGAASLDEYQTEEAKYKAAQAMVKQKQSMVAEKKAMLSSSLSKIREAQADADRAASQAAAAEAVADRMSAGVATANAELDAALTRIDQARANARAAGEEVSSGAAEVRVKSAQQQAMNTMTAQSAAALSVAQTVRGYTEIRAVSQARVLQRLVSPGTVVSPGTLLLRLAQVDRVRLQAYVSATDLRQIRVGSRVWVNNIDRPGGLVVANVTSISPSSDPASRTSVVEALVPNPRRQFLPGQAIQMQFETASADQAITVPTSAVIAREVSATDAGGRQTYSVWTVAVQETKSGTIYTCVMHPQIREKQPGVCPLCDMKLTPEQTGGQRIAHRVDVTVGASDGQRTQIISGVAAGQEVITRGTESLREGQAVQNVPYGEQGPLQLPAPAAAPSAGTGHEGHGT